MDRRDFIKKIGLAAGAIAFSGIAEACQAATTKTNSKKMKIVVLTGSPRRKGNTNTMAEQFIKGATEAGHDVFRFDCATADVHPCIACNHCGMDGDCIYNDDFSKELRPKLLDADMIVFCSPMYYFGFSSQLKRVIDRFYAINYKLMDSGKKGVFLMAYANTAKSEAEPMLMHYHQLLKYLGMTDAGTVVAPGIWPIGAINNTSYTRQSYILGKNI